jgi:F-type H+-transporting ATPase subunit c
MSIDVIRYISITFCFVVAALISCISIGKIGTKALDSIGRNPEAEAGIRTTMILAIAFAEAIAIYGLVLALILVFTK